jgi:hypothetical protein
MSNPVPGEPSNVLPGPGRRPASREARAYCGPAHGMQWTVTEAQPPACVELPCGTSSALYRLVRRPQSNGPARDHLGYYLYVPVTGEWNDPDGDGDGEAKVIALDAGPSGFARQSASRRSRTLPSPGSD